MKVKTLIVDDHEVVRKGLRGLIEECCEICGEASNGKEAIDKVRELEPDLILMDISMPTMNGIEATRLIRLQGVQTRIVIFSMHDSEEMFRFAMEAGADAYLVKTCSAEELRKTILAVLKQLPQQNIKTKDSQNVSPKRCSNDLREAAFPSISALPAGVGEVLARK